MRARYVWSDEAKRLTGSGLVQIDENAPRPVRRAPAILSDTTEPFRSMADGMLYTSKSAYRRSLKRHGMEEVGNEISYLQPQKPPEPTKEEIVQDLKAAYRQHGHDVL